MTESRLLLVLVRIIAILVSVEALDEREIDLQSAFLHAQPSPYLGQCDFQLTCDWTWTVFDKVKSPIDAHLAPSTDASNSKNGYFLWLRGKNEAQLWSHTIPRTGSNCLLEVSLYQVEMLNGVVRLIITTNKTSSVASERRGNNNTSWETARFNLGSISQPHKLGLEIILPYSNSSIAVDNIRLTDCFPELPPVGTTCTEDMFRCHNGSCLNKTRVCDLTADCADGEDEELYCDKMPANARCNFEDGWCGWKNVPERPLNWTLFRGPTPTEKTGPSYDHTYRNATGTYAYVKMSVRVAVRDEYGERATIDSPLFNPTPPYSSDPKSPYHNSCQVRFFYHQYGVQSGSLGLYIVTVKKHHNHTERLWWSYGDRTDDWYNQAVALPDTRHRFYLQFEATKGYSAKGDVAIDDFSLSPECFGIGVPPEVVGDFNYYKPVIEEEQKPEQHVDFANETVVRISTCNATGRFGPSREQCVNEYNKHGVTLASENEMAALNMAGIQRWTAPRGGYYTLVALGARGGKGSGDMGSTLGALVRGVIELEKHQHLYFMVGQPGSDACPKNLGLKANNCQLGNRSNSSSRMGMSVMKEVKNIEIKDGGGGGGGATYVFTVTSNGEQQPILIAGGGGGLGYGPFIDDGVQNARGPAASGMTPASGNVMSGNAGGGGGWNGSINNASGQTSAGVPLSKGGQGGTGCGPNNQGYGDGGFGGGGGGCLSGGGGGGFIGGSTGLKVSKNGEGGYSYASPSLTHVEFKTTANQGPGEIYIIPAISGCGCDFRCLALDQFLSETKCLCPIGWHLSNNSRSCLMDDDTNVAHQTFMIILVVFSIALVFAISGLCVVLYNRYQSKKALIRRRQDMFGNGTELTALRTVSDTMMTEFNPNYEFAGNLYSFKDLPQIPRDNISLVKPLGQGAFGEVFQGVYKYRRNEEHPVAVKTLPSLSTSQAEADFMMEALIMSKFKHPNIVHFIGVSFDKHPRYIVLELLAGGDLKNFLREERPRPDRPTSLCMQDLLMCAFDVANGGKYMEDARFIHRDIAARNCLLTSKGSGRIVKIADFGMARDIYRSDYYRKGGKAMLPIKWMPPESFLDGIFTTKTDVWAFGVLLWEIMSFGYMPYTGCANREVMTMVRNGGRLERPAGCPDPIYGIMTQCWHPQPEGRPSFSTIVERIGYCLQDPDVINREMPNYDKLPVCDREMTIMRPDPDTECINVHAELDRCGYMEPRTIGFQPATYRVGRHVENEAGVVYPGEDEDDEPISEIRDSPNSQLAFRSQSYRNNCTDTSVDIFDDSCASSDADNNVREDRVAQQVSMDNERDKTMRKENENHDKEESRKNGNEGESDEMDIDRENGNPETRQMNSSEPSTRTCSPSHNNSLANLNNVNGIIKKSAFKALSLDPSALYRNTIPYEKIAFSPPQQRTTGSMEIRRDSLSHELPREEECSC